MIVLVGTRDSIIKKGEAPNVTCPHCHSTSTIKYNIHSRYTQITFIPLFPVEKKASLWCSNCDQEIALNDLDSSTISKLAAENNNLRSPLWMYFGSFVIVCYILYSLYSFYKSDSKTSLFIKNPRAEDVYFMKDSKGYYYTFRIDKITKDSIYTTENDYQVYAPYDIDDINVSENYTTKKSNYSKKELLDLFQDGKITAIKRN
ncbi:zinc-ribbon domain-containing protein [Flavobacterium sp.]|uniref:zinc-ribbon domain-containing protein n=1 Tax=Flavobacterium sp. TaxID=239 RepID=UPI0038D1AEDD